jgi:arylsulfatase A-like enzyme
VPGSDLANTGGGARLYASDHGSMSPWNVRNTMLAWGVGFKTRTTVGVPAGNADVAPTILALLGLDDGGDRGHAVGGLDGRVLAEALAGPADPEQVAVDTRVHTVETGAYRAAIQVSTVDGRRYIDKSWRVR